MQVANLQLCKELYELSGWETPLDQFHYNDRDPIPAYDLGYLLRKLPMFSKFAAKDAHTGETVAVDHTRLTVTFADNGQRVACYVTKNTGEWYEPQYADTPENAAAKLAIELHRQGVLRPNSKPKSKLGHDTNNKQGEV